VPRERVPNFGGYVISAAEILRNGADYFAVLCLESEIIIYHVVVRLYLKVGIQPRNAEGAALPQKSAYR